MKEMERYELQKLRELPIEGVAERLGLTIRMHRSLCPFHNDHDPSLHFSVRHNKYRCFVCGASGGPLDLVMKYLNKPFLEACRWLADEHSIIIENLKLNIESVKPQDFNLQSSIFNIQRYERFFERPWLNDEARKFLFEERRLDERVVRWCRLTSWRDKQGVSWLQIPYYDRDGRLVGVQNRNLVKGATPRFRFPQGSQCTIYNLPVLNLLHPGEALYITEGCSDCWAMLSAGHKAIAIPSATLLSKKDVALLQSLCTPPSSHDNISHSTLLPPPSTNFHMFPDRDAPGERLFLQLQEVLPGLVHHQLPPGCKDFSDYYLQTKLRV